MEGINMKLTLNPKPQLRIDPEIRDSIRPQTEAEFKQLESNILADGEEAYKRVMSLHLNTWEGVLDSKKNPVITALFLFDRAYYGKYDEKKFQKRLSKVSCTQALATAKSLGGSTIDGLVSIFVNAYNKGTPKEYRL